MKVGPLELHLNHIVDEQKGCYQGQEGVAAMLKNKRGLPQLLYSVIFPEEDNFYDNETSDEEEYSNHDSPNRVRNKTSLPKVGDVLYVLGSNLKIKVGTVSSVAERGGTSLSETVRLTLVRRSDGILKKMREMDLEIERNDFMGIDMDCDGEGGPSMDGNFGSGIIYPPPMDPLDGLDVVLGNGLTRGVPTYERSHRDDLGKVRTFLRWSNGRCSERRRKAKEAAQREREKEESDNTAAAEAEATVSAKLKR